MLADIHVLDKFEILPIKQSKSVSSFGNRNEYSTLAVFVQKISDNSSMFEIHRYKQACPNLIFTRAL